LAAAIPGVALATIIITAISATVSSTLSLFLNTPCFLLPQRSGVTKAPPSYTTGIIWMITKADATSENAATTRLVEKAKKKGRST
jgi:di/tricarboxylate transporter